MKNACSILLLLNVLIFRLVANDSIARPDKNIAMVKLSDKAYLLQTSYSCNGNLDCNSLLIVDTRDIVLVNTPAKDSLTAILLTYIAQKFQRNVTKVIVSHFHDDSSGGLSTTRKQAITSYSLDKTRDLLKNEKIDVVFSDSMTIALQTMHIQLLYLGAGHSADNIVTWLPDERILFGGCLLKSLRSNDKGNVKDAYLKAWPITVARVKERFTNARIVIPGHFAIGDTAIFAHTELIVKY